MASESRFPFDKRLAHTIGFADGFGINQRHLKAARMAECQHGLVE